MLVEVYRDGYDGRLASRVRIEPFEIIEGVENQIVIDREDRRGPLQPQTVIDRAKTLAKMLGLPYVEHTAWQCLAMSKRACYCPKCRT